MGQSTNGDTPRILDLGQPRELSDAQQQKVIAADRAAAARDRELAALDRRRAAQYLRRAYRDGLTGTLQRDAGTDQLEHEVARAHRTAVPLVVAFLDVEGLKRMNDERGHSAGDALLRAVGNALTAGLRPYDLVVRWGGDEFVCALPGSVEPLARARFDQVRATLRQAQIAVTVGLAELRPDDRLMDAVDRADRELYQARRARR